MYVFNIIAFRYNYCYYIIGYSRRFTIVLSRCETSGEAFVSQADTSMTSFDLRQKNQTDKLK